jgi:hypothetical protein
METQECKIKAKSETGDHRFFNIPWLVEVIIKMTVKIQISIYN